MRKRKRSIGPALLLRGLTVDRQRPDLDALARETDPERFLWSILPHAARSFSASIVVLPGDPAIASAVAYVYCRMLDTYEDLVPDPATCRQELERFAARFDDPGMPSPTQLDDSLARDDRDRVYLVLISRCDLIDRVFRTLPEDVRHEIAELVRSMAEGMIWSTEAFDRQGGVLLDQEQLAHYCRNVIGYPALFTLSQVADGELSAEAREDALLVSEMIQLANVTRDIERDLERGVAYHPALKPYLGRAAEQPEVRRAVEEVREEFLSMALSRAPAYRRIFEGLDLGRTRTVRTAAVLMLLFTDLHYRSCALRTGHLPWAGPRSRLQVVAGSLPSLWSRAWAGQTIRRVESSFLKAGDELAVRGLFSA
ncbi:MAG: squalene/phytoene synthase family protein [Actinomycetota bacterium]|nr:squalene/phytoene synthase family protein [Actinomycetota bacterium]